MTEFLSIPLFDDDFFKLAFRFVTNLVFITLIIRWLYYSGTKQRDYVFTFFMIGIIVFFLCFTLKKYKIDSGVAIGLFALFGILRYRTDPIPIKEMTYLFVIIGISVVNSLANSKMSYAEVLTANVATVAAIYIMEKLWKADKFILKKIKYEKIDNIKPENYALLKSDLEERTGLDIQVIEVGDIDFLKDESTLIIKYLEK